MLLDDLDWRSWALLAFAGFLLVHLVPYLRDPYGFRKYPGPFLAGLSDIWIGRVAAEGHRSERVHELHKEHGEWPLLDLCVGFAGGDQPWAGYTGVIMHPLVSYTLLSSYAWLSS